MGLNNINAEAAGRFVEEARHAPEVAVKTKRVEGQWVFEEGSPQFRATVPYQNGQCTLKSDFAPFMGGWGSAPDPIQYCLYGLAACYAGTFVSVATMEGVTLRSLRVTAENKVNLMRTLGLSQEPIVERVDMTVSVEADAPAERLKEIEKMARERCPGVYCLENPIPLVTHLEIRT